MLKHFIYLMTICCFCFQAYAAEDAGLTALKNAEKKNQFLVAYFYDSKDQANTSKSFKSSVETAAKSFPEKVSPVYIDTNNKADSGLVAKFGLNYAPKPILLILAPNGAVTGSYQKAFTAEQLMVSLPGPGMQACLKGLQTGKMVMVSVQNKNSTDAQAALKGATDFSNDPRFKSQITSVIIDPSSKEEANSLKQLQIASDSTTASTLLLTPPGSLVGKWEGAVTKEAIAQQLTAFMSRAGAGGCATPACGTSCSTPKK